MKGYQKLITVIAGALLASSAAAHHSFVIYDGNQYTTWKGILVSENLNAGSHAWFEFETTSETGEKTVWKAESQATRLWPEDRPTFLEVSEIGGEITVSGWPLRNGAPVAWLHKMENEQTGVGFSIDNRIVQGASQFTFEEGSLLPKEAANLPEFDSEGRRTRTDDGNLTRFGAALMEEMSGIEFDAREEYQSFDENAPIGGMGGMGGGPN